jgi:hypothetical protein
MTLEASTSPIALERDAGSSRACPDSPEACRANGRAFVRIGVPSAAAGLPALGLRFGSGAGGRRACAHLPPRLLSPADVG